MTQADSVPSTPPPSTSPLTPPAQPLVHNTRRDLIAQATIVIAGSTLMGVALTLAMRPLQMKIGPARRDSDEPAVPGTVNASIVSYYRSTSFNKDALAESTRQSRRAILERFRESYGEYRVALMHSAALQKVFNSRSSPAAQRNWMKALRGWINHCLTERMITKDPLTDVKLGRMKKTGGFHTWTEEEIARYRTRHVSGTKARLALELLFQTGHARADTVRMGLQHVRGGKLSMRRQKTSQPFSIPMLPELVAELELRPKTDQSTTDLAFLVTQHGKPFTAAGFGNWFRERCNEAGLPHCSAHGLRKPRQSD